MRKRLFLAAAIIFILLISVLSIGIYNYRISMRDTLALCFESTKAQAVECKISGWAKIADTFLNEKELLNEADRIIGAIEPDKNSVRKTIESSSNTNKVTIYVAKGSSFYTIVLDSSRNDKKRETYAIIDVSLDKYYKNLKSEKEELERIFRSRGDNVRLNSFISGAIDGKLSEREVRSKIMNAFKTVRAKTVEGMESEGLSSLSAYTGSINNFILSKDKKVNIQMAVRYSSYDDKTYIWIGSPVIPVEY